MHFKVVRVPECLATFWPRTLEVPFICVCNLMAPQMTSLEERKSASFLRAVILLGRKLMVLLTVIFQKTCSPEIFRAAFYLTEKRSRRLMHVPVALQGRRGLKCLSAQVTLVWPVIGMDL